MQSLRKPKDERQKRVKVLVIGVTRTEIHISDSKKLLKR